MATTGVGTGNSLLIYTSDDDGVTWDVIAHSTDHTLELSSDTLDTNTKDSDSWREKIASLKSFTLSCEALHAFDAAHGFDELVAIWTAGTVIKVKFSTESSGDTFWSGSAVITSLSLNAPQDDLRTFSCSLEGTGPLTAGTVA